MAQFHPFPSSFPASAAALTECWKLDAGHATTLQPRQAGVFRVGQGKVWVSLDGPHAGHTVVQGDHILEAGDSLPLQMGQRLVIESWYLGEDVDQAEPAFFGWEATEAGAALRRGVAQPSRELVQALRSALAAGGRLALGLVGLGQHALAGHRRTV